MKKISLLLLLLHCFILGSCQGKQHSKNVKLASCYYENNVIDLGVGIAMWNYDCDKNIIIFSDSLLKNEVYNFNICNNAINEICPFFYKPDYGIYHFVVTRLSDEWYEILYNNDKKGYIQANLIFKFVYWDTLLKDYSTGIREKKTGIIYSVKKVSEDTLLVVEKDNNIERVIKWRNKNQLLIDIALLE
ncbi:MAG TPA: hypothetical protein GXZ87_03440 [Bacteroidales bacterium]|nr:hypothetical protein [Bacteroidales bacterium]